MTVLNGDYIFYNFFHVGALLSLLLYCLTWAAPLKTCVAFHVCKIDIEEKVRISQSQT